MTELLLGDPSPSLRWRAAIELGDVGEDDEEVREWRASIDESADVRSLVTRLEQTGDNPQAAGYLLCQLAYLGYRGAAVASAQEEVPWPYGCSGRNEKFFTLSGKAGCLTLRAQLALRILF